MSLFGSASPEFSVQCPCHRGDTPAGPRRSRCEESGDTGSGAVEIHELTFPYHQNAPALAAKGADGSAIAGGVAVELGKPIGAARRRNAAPAAAGVAVPEAAADVDDRSEAREA
jgi:hypothetical protein